MLAPFKLGISLCLVWFLIGCDSKPESKPEATPNAKVGKPTPQGSATQEWFALLGNITAVDKTGESKEALRIAQSYPVPKLPNESTPFTMQPQVRFDQWTLSAMIQDVESNTWRWTNQEFIRVGLADKNAAPAASNWGFTDVVGQRYLQYNFNNNEHEFEVSAERLAMTLAKVTSDSLSLNDVELNITNTGCESILTVHRGDQQSKWNSSVCPERIQLNDAIVETNTHVFAEGVSWVSHTYGQLPTAAGAVVIDRLEIIMPGGKTLNVNRSRRRQGSGPTTVLATLGKNPLPDVLWSEEVAKGAAFAKKINLTIPSLSQTLEVEVPDTINNASYGQESGAQHGVLVTIDGGNVVPGRVFLYPSMEAGT